MSSFIQEDDRDWLLAPLSGDSCRKCARQHRPMSRARNILRNVPQKAHFAAAEVRARLVAVEREEERESGRHAMRDADDVSHVERSQEVARERIVTEPPSTEALAQEHGFAARLYRTRKHRIFVEVLVDVLDQIRDAPISEPGELP
jgi:hypothetical protein